MSSKTSSKTGKVVTFGLGYVGATTTACLLKQGHTVVGIDVSEAKVAAVANGQAPMREPQVNGLLADGHADGRLSTDTAPDRHIPTADIAIIAVGTPSKRGGNLQVEQIRQVAGQIGRALRARPSNAAPLQCIFRSTLPPGTTRDVIVPTIEEAVGEAPGARYEVSFNPEFLREGSAVSDYFDPPTIVLGERHRGASNRAGGLYEGFVTPITEVSYAEAEFTKMVNNGFHGLKVAFANEIGRICLACDVDPQAVMGLLTADRKLNLSPYYLRPGEPFGGSCLPKDLRALLALARAEGARLPVIESVLPSNEIHKDFHVQSIMRTVPPQSHVLQVGLTFKADTDDLRESPLVDQARTLIEEGYRLSIYDPDLTGARLMGANLEFLERKLPDVARHIVTDLSHVDDVDLVVMGKSLGEPLPGHLAGVPSLDGVRLDVGTWTPAHGRTPGPMAPFSHVGAVVGASALERLSERSPERAVQ